MNVTQRFVQKRHLNLFNVFSQSIKRQIAENKELQENVKYLSDESTRLNQTEAMQRAKDAMKSTSKVVQTVGKAASVIGDATFTVVDKTAETMEKVAKPVLETRAGKAISQNVRKIQREISSSSVSARYVEYKPKEERERELEEREREAFAANPLEYKRLRAPVTPNETATAVELHQSSIWEQKWSKFKENNPLMQSVTRVQKNMEESDHPFVERFREWYHNFSKESEHAQVINAIKMVEPGFHIDRFVKDAAEFYIPDIMEAYLQGNMAVLSEWCSEQLCAQFGAGIKAQQEQGLISHSKLLDIRRVELLQTKMLENDIPIILMDFNTQELLLFKNSKGEIVLGKEDHIEHVRYRVVFTKDQCVDAKIPVNPRTKGWRCQECVKIDSWSGI